MADPAHHAISSAKRYGGVPDDYLFCHQFFDQTKRAWADPRHRAILHSTFGIELAIQVFGQTFRRKSDGRAIPTRWIGEQHVLEDLGRIPRIDEWLSKLPVERWMVQGARKFATTIALQELEAREPEHA